MLRTALLGGNSITLDADMSKYIETVSDQGVIEGLEVSSNSVAPGKAWVKATRSNGETIMVLVQNTEALAVDASGTKKIWLEIKQEAIDNGGLNNEDGTGIASIKTGPSVPSQNSLLLASVNNGRVEDERNLIPKIQSVAQRTTSLEQKMETQEQKVERLEEAEGTDHFEERLFAAQDFVSGVHVGFVNHFPELAECDTFTPIGISEPARQFAFNFLGTGNDLVSLALAATRVGSPSQPLTIEIKNELGTEFLGKLTLAHGEIPSEEELNSTNLPNLTGANTPDGYTVFSSGAYNSNYQPRYCFNSSTHYSYATPMGQVNSHIGFSCPKARIMSSFIITGQINSNNLELRGSLNGEDRELIENYREFPPAKKILVPKKKPYSFYRWNATSNGSLTFNGVKIDAEFLPTLPMAVADKPIPTIKGQVYKAIISLNDSVNSAHYVRLKMSNEFRSILGTYYGLIPCIESDGIMESFVERVSTIKIEGTATYKQSRGKLLYPKTNINKGERGTFIFFGGVGLSASTWGIGENSDSITSNKPAIICGIGNVFGLNFMISVIGGLSTTYTAGTIPLGNAVGFLPVIGPDGKKYKYPIFND